MNACPACGQEHAYCDPSDPCDPQALYRQAALELQAEIRAALAWIGAGAEPAVAHNALRRSADKWKSILSELAA